MVSLAGCSCSRHHPPGCRIQRPTPRLSFFSSSSSFFFSLLVSVIAFSLSLSPPPPPPWSTATALIREGCDWISMLRGLSHETRRQKLKTVAIKVLVSTDLTARGIDVERVNLVVNLDVPEIPETYLHRIGRTGRFGTRGVAVTFLTELELGAFETLLVSGSLSMSIGRAVVSIRHSCQGGVARRSVLPSCPWFACYRFPLTAVGCDGGSSTPRPITRDFISRRRATRAVRSCPTPLTMVRTALASCSRPRARAESVQQLRRQCRVVRPGCWRRCRRRTRSKGCRCASGSGANSQPRGAGPTRKRKDARSCTGMKWR